MAINPSSLIVQSRAAVAKVKAITTRKMAFIVQPQIVAIINLTTVIKSMLETIATHIRTRKDDYHFTTNHKIAASRTIGNPPSVPTHTSDAQAVYNPQPPSTAQTQTIHIAAAAITVKNQPRP